jgi:hypothetical protein
MKDDFEKTVLDKMRKIDISGYVDFLRKNCMTDLYKTDKTKPNILIETRLEKEIKGVEIRLIKGSTRYFSNKIKLVFSTGTFIEVYLFAFFHASQKDVNVCFIDGNFLKSCTSFYLPTVDEGTEVEVSVFYKN